MKQTAVYCQEMVSHKGDTYYADFFPSIGQVRMCMDSRQPRPIHLCFVTETDKTDGNYWAWWNNEEQRFMMIFHGRPLVEICFPYGSKVEEELGRGKVMRVEITIMHHNVNR